MPYADDENSRNVCQRLSRVAYGGQKQQEITKLKHVNPKRAKSVNRIRDNFDVE
jgi:hypothetical protein